MDLALGKTHLVQMLLFTCSVISDSLQPHGQDSLSITNSWSLLKLMPTESVMSSNHLILCRPILFLPPIFPSIRVFSNESTLGIKWPKYWSLSFSISPSNEYSGLISFSDWLFWSPCSPRDSRVFNTTVQKHQFFSAQPSLHPTLTSVHDYWKNQSSD